MNIGSDVDYILEIELEHELKKYYHDIVTIDFYKGVIRAKDINGIIIHIPKHMIHGMRIITADVWKYSDMDNLRRIKDED